MHCIHTPLENFSVTFLCHLLLYSFIPLIKKKKLKNQIASSHALKLKVLPAPFLFLSQPKMGVSGDLVPLINFTPRFNT